MARFPSRREALALVGSALTAGAGCSGLPFTSSESSQLELLPANFTSEKQLLDVEVLGSDADRRNEALALNRSFELTPDGRDPDPPVIDDRLYLVRANLSGYRDVHTHYHHYPDTNSRDDGPRVLEVGVFSESERQQPYIEFEAYAGRRD